MATASAHRRTSKQKARKTTRVPKKAKSRAASKSRQRKVALKAKAPSRRIKTKAPSRRIKAKVSSRRIKAKASSRGTKAKAARKAKKETISSARHPVHKESKKMEAESRKSAFRTDTTSAPNASPRLLRRTKTTAAALSLLEKGIELIFQKDFKKARGELKTLLETYPEEMDILARARSYMQICDREEASQKRPPVTTDQLYALGILEHNRANYDSAISYFLQSLELHPDADYIYYSVAASLAMKGNLAESMKNLRRAVDLNEDSRIYAKNDADFSALQTQEDFAELVGLGQPTATEPER
jgi:tetratricopeptide (TPR) repeat protein